MAALDALHAAASSALPTARTVPGLSPALDTLLAAVGEARSAHATAAILAAPLVA